MVLVIGTSYKQLIASPDIQWTNVYMLNSANILAAMANLQDISNAEAQVMGETARVYKLHCIAKEGGFGVQEEVDKPGVQNVADPDTMLPLWNCVKCTFFSATGRPEIKYLKLPLYIDMIEGVNINNAVQTAVQLDYTGHLVSIPQYVGPNGETHIAGSTSQVIQMRQTDWHRRFRPGFRRGWVPVGP